MTIRDQDITIEDGDAVTITPGPQGVRSSDGSTQDISGFNALVTLAEYEGGSVVIQFDQSNSQFEITDGPNGQYEVTFDPFNTTGLADEKPVDYYYEIELRDNTDPHTITTGTMTVRPSY